MRSNIAWTWGSSRVPGVPELPIVIALAGESYCSSERKPTRFLNLSGAFWARPLKDGIGAVGLTKVEAMEAGRSFEPTWERLGPGPSLPLSPILWQARQPDCPTTSLPALKVVISAGVSEV